MIFDLAQDFHDAVAAMPREHPKRRMLELLDEAVLRDTRFIARHPTTLFQCLWNTCWWYDCPEAAEHYDPPQNGWSSEGPPWLRPGPRLYAILESWRRGKQEDVSFTWLRNHEPPAPHLGTGLRFHIKHQDKVLAVAFSQDGERVATASVDGTIRLWDSVTGESLACLSSLYGVVTRVAFLPDGLRVVAGYEWRGVRVFDIQSGAETACLTEDRETVRRLAITRDGTWLAAGFCDGKARFWDSATLEPRGEVRLGSTYVRDVALSADGRSIIATGDHGNADIYDVDTGAHRVSLEGPEHHGFLSVALSPDGRAAATGGDDGIVRLWDAGTGKELMALEEHPDDISCLAFSPDGARLVSGCLDWTVRLWDARSGALLHWLIGHNDYVVDVAFSPDGRLIADASMDGRAAVWKSERSDPLARLRNSWFGGHVMALSPDGRKIATDTPPDVTLSNSESGMPENRIECGKYKLTALAFSPDGSRVLTAGYEWHTAKVQVWDGAGGAELASFDLGFGVDSLIWRVALSRDGRVVACLSSSYTFWAREAETRRQLLWLGDLDIGYPPLCFDIAPDSRRVVTGHADGALCIWSLETGEQIDLIQADDFPIRDVAWCSGGEEVVTAGDASMQRWNVASRRRLGIYKMECPSAVLRDSFASVVTKEDTAIVDLKTLRPVTWFRAALAPITADSSGRIWAGADARRPYLLRVEEWRHP